MKLSEKQARFSRMFARLVLYACAQGYQPVIAEVARTKEQQALYVQQGTSQTMKSKHLDRLAGDLLLFRQGTYLTQAPDYAFLGTYWKGLDPHNVWVGSGSDWSMQIISSMRAKEKA